MNSRDRDSNTTQRRTLRPERDYRTGESPVSACLVVLQGRRLGQRVNIGSEPLVIGRAPECDLQIVDRSISRQHAKIWQDSSGYRIKDLDSTNKTFVNDQPIIEAELKDGDHVVVGNCVLKFMERSSVEARYHEEIYQLATIDPLTGLYNRRQFLELLEREIARTASHHRPLAMLLIDLDHFKQINDQFGHLVGDAVLRKVATSLKEVAREDCIIARIGGEEFVAVLPEQDLVVANDFAQLLCDKVAGLDLDERCGSQRLTVSIGVTLWRSDMPAASDLLHAADIELYRAKQSGRNRVSSARMD